VAEWAAAIDAGARAAARLPAGSFHQLRYEDLVASPEEHLRSLCEFLGETYDPAMAEPNRLASEIVPRNRSWHRRTHAPVTTERIGAWTGRLEPWQVGLCEAAVGDRLTSLGYALSDARRPPRWQRLRYDWAALRPHLSPVKRSVVGAWDRLRPTPPIAAVPVPAPVPPRSVPAP
jgi:hypothetical protein